MVIECDVRHGATSCESVKRDAVFSTDSNRKDGLQALFKLTKKGEPLIIVEWECAHQRFVLKTEIFTQCGMHMACNQFRAKGRSLKCCRIDFY